MNFKDVVIYSDADNTFLKTWGENVEASAPQNNLDAIKYFMDKGGHFSIATGREHSSIERFFNYKLNLPIVQSNGVLIYDTINNKVIKADYLEKDIKKEIIDLCLNKKNYYLCCGVDDAIYQIDFNDERDNSLHDVVRKHVSIDYCLNNNVCKLCFVVKENEMEELKREVNQLKCKKKINSVQSSKIYLECFTVNANKGNGIKAALELTGLIDKTLVCIGDYYNDLPMLNIADIKACPDNSPQDIKDICDIVVCNNNEGAIADLIYKLEKM